MWCMFVTLVEHWILQQVSDMIVFVNSLYVTLVYIICLTYFSCSLLQVLATIILLLTVREEAEQTLMSPMETI